MSKEMEIYKNMLTGKIEIKDECIYIERDSVGLGDDINAPHRIKIFFKKDSRLSDVVKKLTNYVVRMNNYVWEICEDKETFAYIKIDSTGNITYELVKPDDSIADLKIKSLYCKNMGEMNKI